MKKTITLVLSGCLVACMAISVSASYSYNYINVDSNLPNYGQSWDYNSGTPLFADATYEVRALSNEADVYPILVGSNGRVNTLRFIGKSTTFYCRADSSDASNAYKYRYNSDSQSSYVVPDGWYLSDATTFMWTGTQFYPLYDDVQTAIDDITTGASSQVQSSFSIPAGWVAYFKTNSDVNLSCVQPDYSMVGSNPFATNNQMYGFANSLPASGTTFPFGGMSYIPWQKGGNRNIWGQTRDSVALIDNGSVYTVIYNPTFQEGTGGSGASSDDSTNGAITISGTNISDIRIYPLSGQFINTGNGYHFVSGSDSYDTNYVDGIIDSETGSVVYEDSNGNVIVPNVGGQNSIPEIASAESFFSAIKHILVGIANDLGTIFGFAYEAVVTLVSTASAFVTTLGGLYAWLPSPISSVLISAITLAITIGVFKVFM